MYKPHPNFVPPKDPNTIIWRYLDFTKFVSLLEKRALFFTRSDKFEDKFEGVSPESEMIYRAMLGKGQDGYDFQESYALMTRVEQKQRKDMAINCWHMNKSESLAMWKIYLKSSEGLAIRSTFSRLRDSFNIHKSDDILIGKVNYIDFDTSPPTKGLFYNFTHKRTFFEYENELRAMVYRLHPDIKNPKKALSLHDFTSLDGFVAGDYISTDLDILISEVVLAPNSPMWYEELVRSMIQRYGMDKPISRSKLETNPYEKALNK